MAIFSNQAMALIAKMIKSNMRLKIWVCVVFTGAAVVVSFVLISYELKQVELEQLDLFLDISPLIQEAFLSLEIVGDSQVSNHQERLWFEADVIYHHSKV